MKLTFKFSCAFALLVLLSGSFFNARRERHESAEEHENNNFKINSTKIRELEVFRAQQQKEFNLRQEVINEKRKSGVSKQITKKEQDILNADRRKFNLESNKNIVNAMIVAIEMMLKDKTTSKGERSQLTDKLDDLQQKQQRMQNKNNDQG